MERILNHTENSAPSPRRVFGTSTNPLRFSTPHIPSSLENAAVSLASISHNTEFYTTTNQSTIGQFTSQLRNTQRPTSAGDVRRKSFSSFESLKERKQEQLNEFYSTTNNLNDAASMYNSTYRSTFTGVTRSATPKPYPISSELSGLAPPLPQKSVLPVDSTIPNLNFTKPAMNTSTAPKDEPISIASPAVQDDTISVKSEPKSSSSQNSTLSNSGKGFIIPSSIIHEDLPVFRANKHMPLQVKQIAPEVTQVAIEDPVNDAKVVYEIHDVEVPSNYQINKALAQEKQFNQQLQRESEKNFSRQTQQSIDEFMKKQKEFYDTQRKNLEREYNEWKKKQSDFHVRQKQLNDKENSQLRQYYDNTLKDIKAQEKQSLEVKTDVKKKYSIELENQIKAQEIKKMEEKQQRQEPSPSALLVDRPEYIEYKNMVKKNLKEFWTKQEEEKKSREITEKTLERALFTQSVQQEMETLKRDIEQAAKRREESRNRIKSDWIQSMDESQKRKETTKDVVQQERDARAKDLSNYEDFKQQALKMRMDSIKMRKEELDKQLQTLGAMKKTEEQKNREFEIDTMQKFKEINTKKRVLFRSKSTNRILTPSDVALRDSSKHSSLRNNTHIFS